MDYTAPLVSPDVWDRVRVMRGPLIRVYESSHSCSSDIAYNCTHTLLADSSIRGVISVRDAQTGANLQKMPGSTRDVGAIAFYPWHPNMLAVADISGDVRIWDTRRRPCSRIIQFVSTVNALQFAEDKVLAVACSDGSVRFCDVEAGTVNARRALEHADSVVCLDMHPARQLIVTGSRSGDAARIWDVRTKKEVCTLRGHDDTINSVRFHPDPESHIVVTGSADQSVLVWDRRMPSKRMHFLRRCSTVYSLSFDRGGEKLAVGSGVDILIVDASRNMYDRCFMLDYPNIRNTFALCFNRENGTLATAGEHRGIVKHYSYLSQHYVYVWDTTWCLDTEAAVREWLAQ